MEPLLEELLRSLWGSEANLLELCFGRFPYGISTPRQLLRSLGPPSVRVVKTVFLENGVFVPYRKQVVLTKHGENDDLHSFYPQRKQGAPLLRARNRRK